MAALDTFSRLDSLTKLLMLLGFGFLCANVRVLSQFIRFLRLRSSALLTWSGPRPQFYRLFLGIGAMLAVLILLKLVWLKKPIFGESMMLVYYVGALPLSMRISRGFYQDGIWGENGFVPYSRIGGLTWREEGQLTLVMIHRVRALAQSLVVPDRYYGAARRLLRDKIAAHDIHFTGKSLDLGAHDERDDV
jgi:hypothetical protein